MVSVFFRLICPSLAKKPTYLCTGLEFLRALAFRPFLVSYLFPFTFNYFLSLDPCLLDLSFTHGECLWCLAWFDRDMNQKTRMLICWLCFRYR